MFKLLTGCHLVRTGTMTERESRIYISGHPDDFGKCTEVSMLNLLKSCISGGQKNLTWWNYK
jgi:hypothetical protein